MGGNRRGGTMLAGFSILGVAGLVCKVIGMVFRVQLSARIGAQGIGLYQAVYPTYTLLLTLSTAGLPVAISRMVAEATTTRDERGAKKILTTALGLVGTIGLALTALMLMGSGWLAERIGASDAATGVSAKMGFQMIAPSIVIVALMSAFRGYMQGHRVMLPTGISQLIEQLAKVVISFPLAAWGMARGGVAMAAAMALLGITIGEALALGYMAVSSMVWMRRNGGTGDDPPSAGVPVAPSAAGETPPSGDIGGEGYPSAGKASPRRHSVLFRMLTIAVPITLGAAIVPSLGFIDSAMIINRLISAGFSHGDAQTLYGLQSGAVLSLLNVPTALALAVAMSLVPTISAANARGDKAEVSGQTLLSLRLAFLIGLPCAMGMSLLSTPIIRLLYSGYTADQIATAGRLLSIGAFTIPLFILVQAAEGALQGVGLQRIPMWTLVIGAAVKTSLNYLLIGLPGINIFGAPIASLACYALVASINLAFAMKRTGARFHLMDLIVRPGLCTLIMAAAVLACQAILGTDSSIKTLTAVGAGMLAYVIAAPATGAVRRDDLSQFPGLSRLSGRFSKKKAL
ncbi:MAG: polysaccharide biosynthesis protein [Oscillospiraceae bacterium]|jgi:stage V sporulation protein B|nr:polysaccharide biosynthesis protein [Oscillospiraceae bacterium]